MRRWASLDPAFYVGLALVVLSVGIAWRAVDLGLGEMRSPGPGFVFFWTSIFLGVLAVRMMVKALRAGRGSAAPLWSGLAWGKVVGVAVSLIAYAVVLEYLGYIITTGLFSAYLYALLADARRRWWAIVAGAIATAVITYLIFDRVFSVQLPKGIFGF